jgi:hypothetical protein
MLRCIGDMIDDAGCFFARYNMYWLAARCMSLAEFLDPSRIADADDIEHGPTE